ncbi:DUF4286 family protein [Sphingobacterium sp. SGG-5]|uniref:DUF4286 family protein n=1 Tax=Sphingobacterium sp. SGG-5 TaxID=2710881 RepID=UPI0013E9F0CE|nr:DUF4286 family protein [Sphingobacterium sp. SGG-5]NGM62918.1 DUF4286 family protein [Sphingobacterium sp. SGG-5]
MYLYNISILVESPVHDTFLHWLQSEWLPSIRHDVKFLKMLDTPHEGHTYCVQLVVNSENDIRIFRDDHLVALQQYIGTHYGEKVFLFDSTMEYLSGQ